MDPNFSETLGMNVFDRVFETADKERLFFDEAVWLPQDQECPDTGYPRCPDCGGGGDLRNVVDIFSDTNYVYAVWNDSRLGAEYKAGYLRISHDKGLTWSLEYKIIDDTEHPWEIDIYAADEKFYMVWKEQDAPEYIHQTYFMYGQWYVPGDIDNSGEIDIADLVGLVNYMFAGGDAPNPIDAGQIDGNDAIDISDLVDFVSYMFAGGSPPVGGEIGF